MNWKNTSTKLFQMVLILIFVCFITTKVIQWKKEETGTSIIQHTGKIFLPSITICPVQDLLHLFAKGKNLTLKDLESVKIEPRIKSATFWAGMEEFTYEGMEWINIPEDGKWNQENTSFSQSLKHDFIWKESLAFDRFPDAGGVPVVLKCFTYDPPFDTVENPKSAKVCVSFHSE